MGMYYNLFALGKQLDPVVSVPYVDAFGTGRVDSSKEHSSYLRLWFKVFNRQCSQLFHFPKSQIVDSVEKLEKQLRQA